MVLFQLNQVVGNLISSVVLYKTPNKLTLNQTILNGTYSKILNSTIDQCGPNDLPTRQDEFIKPDQWTVYLLCSIYATLSIIGILVLFIFLDNIKPSNAKGIFFHLLHQLN